MKLIDRIQCAAVYIVEGGRFDGPNGERTAEENHCFMSGLELTADEAINEAVRQYPALAGMTEYRVQAVEFDPASFNAEIIDRPDAPLSA